MGIRVSGCEGLEGLVFTGFLGAYRAFIGAVRVCTGLGGLAVLRHSG